MKISKNIVIVFLSSIISFGVYQALSCMAQNNKAPDEKEVMPTCYKPMANPTITPEIKAIDLQNRLNTLEQQYKEKKIDKKAYKQAKENILKEMKNLK